MRYSLAPLALAALAVAKPVPGGVSSAVAPSSSPPAGCSTSYSGTFEIQVVNVTSSSKRAVQKRDTALLISLSNGVLTDADGRTGYIAANQQFQFDDPPQAGAIYTSGFSVCSNGSLAIGGDAVWYQCLSGTFYNLYDASTGAQCSQVYIDVIGAGSSSPTTVASQQSDGQITATPAASQQSDGQVTETPVSSAECTEYSDGQPQCASAAPVTQISDGQIQATTAGAVSQISDGQIQATTAGAVSQISDGQIQATTAAPVTQISDGQIQATTAAVSQISDGQIQATTGAPVTQISDGQIQATTAVAVSQISDGQIQATTGANSTIMVPTPSAVPATGSGSIVTVGMTFGLVAAVFAVILL